MSFSFLRLPAVLKKRGVGKSKHYRDVAEGLFTRPVRIGARAAAWPSHEVESLNAARLRGESDETIRLIVRKLHELRDDARSIAA